MLVITRPAGAHLEAETSSRAILNRFEPAPGSELTAIYRVKMGRAIPTPPPGGVFFRYGFLARSRGAVGSVSETRPIPLPNAAISPWPPRALQTPPSPRDPSREPCHRRQTPWDWWSGTALHAQPTHARARWNAHGCHVARTTAAGSVGIQTQ